MIAREYMQYRKENACEPLTHILTYDLSVMIWTTNSMSKKKIPFIDEKKLEEIQFFEIIKVW